MKLNNIVNESTEKDYTDLTLDFVARYKEFYIKTNNIICAKTDLTPLTINNDISTELDLFDDNGISKLKFGNSGFGCVTIEDVNSVKSLKNLPSRASTLKLINLQNIDKFDLDIGHISNLYITNCSFRDLTDLNLSVDICPYIFISRCKYLDSFNLMPTNKKPKYRTSALTISDSTLQQVKTDIICNILQLDNINGLKNFKYYPPLINSLKLRDINDFESWVGIDEYDDLSYLQIRGISFTCYKSMMLILLCKKNVMLDIRCSNFNTEVLSIIEKYMKKDLSERRDHLMDYAIELIDAGFPEAAEL